MGRAQGQNVGTAKTDSNSAWTRFGSRRASDGEGLGFQGLGSYGVNNGALMMNNTILGGSFL